MAKEKSTTELRDEKKQLSTRAQEIISLAKTEKRGFKDEENEEIASIQIRKAEIDESLSRTKLSCISAS